MFLNYSNNLKSKRDPFLAFQILTSYIIYSDDKMRLFIVYFLYDKMDVIPSYHKKENVNIFLKNLCHARLLN